MPFLFLRSPSLSAYRVLIHDVVLVNDPIYGKLAAIPFARLVDRFGDRHTISTYIAKFARVALGMLMRAIKAEQAKYHRMDESARVEYERDQDWDPAFIRSVLVTNVLSCILSSRHLAVKKAVLFEVQNAAAEYTNLFQLSHAGLTSLLLMQHEHTIAETSRLYDEMDMQKKGRLTKREVMALAMGRSPLTSRLQLIFAEFDRNGNGRISKRECLHAITHSSLVKDLSIDVRLNCPLQMICESKMFCN